MKFQAQRGVCSENPGNTMPAFVSHYIAGYGITASLEKAVKLSAFVVSQNEAIPDYNIKNI